MKVTKRVQYGLDVILAMARHEDDVSHSASALSRKLEIPEPFLARILNELSRAGLVQSVRGLRGGFLLSRAPKTIQVLDIWIALGGELLPVRCPKGIRNCIPTDDCPYRTYWCAFARSMIASMQVDVGTLLSQLPVPVEQHSQPLSSNAG